MTRPETRSIAVLIACALLTHAQLARATEAETELSLGPQYVWLGGEARLSLPHDFLVGAGFAAVSDYRFTRAGMRAVMGADGDAGSLTLAVGYAPRQQGRGWVELEPEGALKRQIAGLDFAWTARLGLRRADVPSARTGQAIEAIDQLQVQVEMAIEQGERWRLELLGDLAFYDRDLARPWLASGDFGPLVTIAGWPERYAVRGLIEVWCADRVRLELGVGGIGFAGNQGSGVMPLVGVKLGPLGGTTVGAAIEPLIPLGSAAPARLTFRLEVSWER